MKGFLRFIGVFTATVLLLNILNAFSAGVSAESEDNQAANTPLLQNENFVLELKPENGEVVISEKNSGCVWYTNPQGSFAEEDSRLKSQIIVSYYEDQSYKSIDSYSKCAVKEDGISWSGNGKELRVSYNIGDDSFSADILPMVISKERLENKILKKLSREEQDTVLKRYTLYSAKKLDAYTLKSIKLTYPAIEKHDIYVRNSIPDYIAEEIYALFEKAGYTTEDLQRDCDENGVKNEYKPKPFFCFELVYSLNSNGFSVSLDPSKIDYNEDYKPCSIELLPYFAAAGKEENGYMLVPDGSGAVINYNNGKTDTEAYWKRFFSDDNSLSKNEKEAESAESLLPFFAASGDSTAFIATIDKGYEQAGIKACVSGKENSYNFIHPFFDLFASDKVSISSNEYDTFILTANSIFSSDIKISYRLISGYASYSDFARIYKEYLTESSILSKEKNSEYGNEVILLNLVSSAYTSKKFLGFNYNKIVPLTTYKQAKEIVEKTGLDAAVNFENATSGGLKQKRADKVNLLSALGSKKELEALQEEVENVGISYYALRAGSVKKSMRAATMSKNSSKIYEYDIVSRYIKPADYMWVVSGGKISSLAKSIMSSAQKTGIKNLELRDAGYELNSDFSSESYADRHSARISAEKYLQTLSDGVSLTAKKGSIYSLKYLSGVTDIPTSSSGYLIEDFSVPFYEMVLSGRLTYTSSALNDAVSIKAQFLKSVETGARLKATWIYETAENQVYGSERYFNYKYTESLNEIKEYADSYAPLYKKIYGASITDHKYINDSVTKTTYDNGICVYVNYGGSDLNVDGNSVKAESFYYTEKG